jgi:hypothetical protein
MWPARSCGWVFQEVVARTRVEASPTAQRGRVVHVVQYDKL